MRNNDVLKLATKYLDAERECQQLQAQVDNFKEKQRRIRESLKPMEQKLLETVGANIQESVIPVGKQALIISYNTNGNRMRITNRVVVAE